MAKRNNLISFGEGEGGDGGHEYGHGKVISPT